MKKIVQQQRVCSPCSRHPMMTGLFIIGLTVCIAVGESQAQEQHYTIKDIGTLPGLKASQPSALNAQGDLTGTATAGEFGHAFLYFNGLEKDQLEQLGNLGSRGFGIGPAGVVVGDAFVVADFGPVSHAALFKGNDTIDLGVLNGQAFSRANGVNATNQVVGFSGPARDSGQSRAFIWTNATGMIDIGTLGGAYAQTNAINDAGWVTGTSEVADSFVPGTTHAFIYQPLSQIERNTKEMRDLGTLGGNISSGTSINSSNHVVGYSTVSPTDDRVHAFFHDGKSMIDLGSLASEGIGEDSSALAMNNNDQVVGVSYSPTVIRDQFNQAAFVWTNDPKPENRLINLNALIGTEAKSLWLFSAVAINDRGQIAALAYDYGDKSVRAVLLTPIK